jgi:hypothetical protein
MSNVFKKSVSYFDDFSYKDFDDCWRSLYLDKLKNIYRDDRDNVIIEEELIKRLIKKIDPVRLYDYDFMYGYVRSHLDNYLNDDFTFMDLRRAKK